MAGKKRTNKIDLILAIEKTRGNFSAIARILGITRPAVSQRVKRDPALQALVAEAREKLLDSAEAGLAQAVRAKKPWAIKFVLSTVGRSRGYTKTLSVEGSNDTTGVVIILPHNGRDDVPDVPDSGASAMPSIKTTGKNIENS